MNEHPTSQHAGFRPDPSRYQWKLKQFLSALVVLFISLAVITLGFFILDINTRAGLGMMIGTVLFVTIFFTLQNPFTGYCLCFISSFFLLLPERMFYNGTVLPVGLIPEALTYLTLFSLILDGQVKRKLLRQFLLIPLIIWIGIMLLYYLLEYFNPNMEGVLGWFNFVRKQLSYLVFIFISYVFFSAPSKIRAFTLLWLIVLLVEALYVCKQQWLGFFEFEWNWVTSDPMRMALYVNGDFSRKFGLVSDPAAAGILFSCGMIFSIVLALRESKVMLRFFYSLVGFFCVLAAAYSGTRTAVLMIVAAILFYCVLTIYERRTIIFMAVFSVLVGILLIQPVYNNDVINRMRSAFYGPKDPSAHVRDVNRQLVQPYVYAHPFGGGLLTSGPIGKIYNPNHYLSKIPPDSGYMQVLMEQGPVGLALLLIFYFLVLRTGIRYFYRAKLSYTKNLYAAHLVAIFSMMVGQISQMAIGQYPSVLYFYAAITILLVLHKHDPVIKEPELLQAGR